MIVALAGGIGAARFLQGLARIVPQETVTVIGNIGDDIDLFGLHISPDLDIVTYTLAGLVDPEKGWGFRNDTYESLGMLRKYGYETWFNIGDRDLATHIHRSLLLRRGMRLSEVTQYIARSLGVRARLLPASDDSLETYVETSKGRMHFEEYLIKWKTKPKIRRVIFNGATKAKPAKGVLDSIRKASGIIVSPSNPIVSIGSILAVPGIRGALQRTRATIVGISPIVGGRALKGPADKMMRSLGMEPSAVGVAKAYSDFLDTLVIDSADRKLAPQIQMLGIKAVVANTIMRTMSDKTRLARLAISELAN